MSTGYFCRKDFKMCCGHIRKKSAYTRGHDVTHDAPMTLVLILFINIDLSKINKNILTNRFAMHIISPKNREILEIEFRK